MRQILLIILLSHFTLTLYSQGTRNKDEDEISFLIDQYSLARERKDTLLLKSILTAGIDQLVSSGEWRYGK